MKTKFTLLTLLLISLLACDQKPKHYSEDWDDLNSYPQAEWLNDLKFGMYFHWNYNSIAGVSGWYGRKMYDTTNFTYGKHLKRYGDPKEFGYKDFEPLFTAEKFSAKEWVEDIRRSGGRFVVGMAVHHDGFDMYDSSYTEWNSVDKEPHIDIIGELAKEARRCDMKFGATSHLAWNWQYFSSFLYPDKFDALEAPELYNIHDPEKGPTKEFVKEWYNRTTELIDKYELDFLWFDFGTGDGGYSKEYTRKLTAHYFNKAGEWGKQVAIASKLGFYNDKSKVTDCEQGKFGYIRYPLWMADCSMTAGWFNIEDKPAPHTELSGKYWLHQLIDIVSKNGTLLLNLGPHADGAWPEAYKRELYKMGDWLTANSEAIYYTKPWHRYGEGPNHGGNGTYDNLGTTFTGDDIRFTRTDKALYAIMCGYREGTIKIKSLGQGDIEGVKIENITLVGSDKKITWREGEEALEIDMPQCDTSLFAYTFKIEGEGLFPTREDEYQHIMTEFAQRDVKSIKISLDGDGVVALSEVVLYSGRTTAKVERLTMSSIEGDCVAERAFDNNFNGHPLMESSAVTMQESKPWINIELSEPQSIERIELFKALGSGSESFDKLNITLYDVEGKEIITKKVSNN